jgi:pyruvate/2-oxoglutarate dehydrogenase complex dihydrolipoamide dehydrogenase (E3) component
MEYDYDLAVIGAGTAGLAAACAADESGARVALIEAGKVGGKNLWGGGIAARTLTRSAKVFDLVQRAEEFGVHMEKPRVIWNAVQLRVADVRDQIRAKQRARLSASKIEVISGRASFIDNQTVEIAESGRRISAGNFILATGSKPVWPSVEGLGEAGAITPEGLLARKTLPRTLAFVGGGPVACELAQAFKRLGAAVTILHEGDRLLPEEEPAISETLATLLRNEGIEIHLQCRLQKAGPGDPRKWIEFETAEGPQKVEAGELVVVYGQTPNFEGLNLEAAGIQTENGIPPINEDFQTNVRHIWVAGDATGHHYFNHHAEYEGQTAAGKSIFGEKLMITPRLVSWAVFTDPEVAHLGLTQAETEAKYGTAKVFQARFKDVDRAIIEGETSGFIQVVTTEAQRIVGVHIIGHAAGDLIGSFIPLVKGGKPLSALGNGLFPYPSFNEIATLVANDN